MSLATTSSRRIVSSLGRIVSAGVLATSLLVAGEASAGSTELEAHTSTQAEPPLLLMPRSGPRYGMRMVEGPAVPPQAPLPPQAYVEPPKGVGLIVGGSLVAVLVGLPFTIWGVSIVSAGNVTQDAGEDTSLEPATDIAGGFVKGVGVAFLVVGIAGLGGGGTMIGFGARNAARHREWKQMHGIALSPSVGATTLRTPTYGFNMRF